MQGCTDPLPPLLLLPFPIPRDPKFFRAKLHKIELGNGNTLSIEGAKGGKQIQAISVRMISFSFSLGVS